MCASLRNQPTKEELHKWVVDPRPRKMKSDTIAPVVAGGSSGDDERNDVALMQSQGGTKNMESASAAKAKDTGVVVTPEKKATPNTCETKPPAIENNHPVKLFLKNVSESVVTYSPVDISAIEWESLPGSATLMNDLESDDPNRVIIELDPNDIDIPDFILRAMPFPEA